MAENARRGHRRSEIEQSTWNDLKVWLDEADSACRPVHASTTRLGNSGGWVPDPVGRDIGLTTANGEMSFQCIAPAGAALFNSARR
jgi:hypothetical protein